MAESTTHAPETSKHDDHHVKTYWRVFWALLTFTLIEYFYAHIFKDAIVTLILGLMTWALIKAALVGLYFMHVKYEGKWIWAMLLPAAFLATFIMIMLYPDIVLHENADLPIAERQAEDEDEVSAPTPVTASPAPAAAASGEHK